MFFSHSFRRCDFRSSDLFQFRCIDQLKKDFRRCEKNSSRSSEIRCSDPLPNTFGNFKLYYQNIVHHIKKIRFFVLYPAAA
jgi:hypothetical protein